MHRCGIGYLHCLFGFGFARLVIYGCLANDFHIIVAVCVLTAITDFELCGWTIICACPFSCVYVMFPLACDKKLTRLSFSLAGRAWDHNE